MNTTLVANLMICLIQIWQGTTTKYDLTKSTKLICKRYLSYSKIRTTGYGYQMVSDLLHRVYKWVGDLLLGWGSPAWSSSTHYFIFIICCVLVCYTRHLRRPGGCWIFQVLF